MTKNIITHFLLTASTLFSGCKIAQAAEKIQLAIQVPNGGWRVKIVEIRETPKNIYVLAHLYRLPGMAADVISTARAGVDVSVPPKPQKILVTGKTWTWENTENYEFLTSAQSPGKDFAAARVIYSAPADPVANREAK